MLRRGTGNSESTTLPRRIVVCEAPHHRVGLKPTTCLSGGYLPYLHHGKRKTDSARQGLGSPLQLKGGASRLKTLPSNGCRVESECTKARAKEKSAPSLFGRCHPAN